MSANIVNLADYKGRKEDSEESLSGPARCLQCDHTWVAVAPVGMRWLDCPSCKSSKGHLEGRVNRGEFDWFCGCGNDLFRICEESAYCTVCGTLVEGAHFD